MRLSSWTRPRRDCSEQLVCMVCFDNTNICTRSKHFQLLKLNFFFNIMITIARDTNFNGRDLYFLLEICITLKQIYMFPYRN